MIRADDYFALVQAYPGLFRNPSSGGFVILLDEYEIHAVETSMAQKLQARNLPSEWAQVGIVYEDQYGYMLRDAVRFPGGSCGTYIRFIGKEDDARGAIIVPIYQGQPLLFRRFSHGTRSWHLMLPQIQGLRGQSSEQRARSMLREDMGAEIRSLRCIGQIACGLGMADSGTTDLFSVDLTTYRTPNEREGITDIVPVSISELERMIRDSEITDALTIMAYLRAKNEQMLTKTDGE